MEFSKKEVSALKPQPEILEEKTRTSMAEMQICDSVLPFKCDNPDCGKEYDQELFALATLLWGFIVLIAEEDETALVGLTCTECKKTTIRKYRAYEAMDLIWTLSQHLERHHGLFFDNSPIEQRCRLKYYSVQHLIEEGFINIEFPKTVQNNEILYSTLTEIPFEKYSKSLQELYPFSISETDTSFVLKVENNESYKAMPRTFFNVNKEPINLNGKNLFPDIDYMLFDQNNEVVNMILKHIIEPNALLYKDDCFVETSDVWEIEDFSEEEKLSLMKKNDLLMEEFLEFSISHLSWKRKSFQENFMGFIAKLKDIRNRIDFELIYRNELVNKYGRIFYYKTKTIDEQRYAIDYTRDVFEWWRSSPMSTKSTEMGYPPLAKTEAIPFHWIHGSELMNKWRLNAFEIINLIQHYELIAYDAFCSVIIDKDSLGPDLIEKLLNGDAEQQKSAMQRLCFHPDNIAAFEDFYGEQLALEKMKMEPSSPPKAVSDDANMDMEPPPPSISVSDNQEMDFRLEDEELNPTPPKKDLRKLTKECCRARAKQLWEKYPEMKIAHVVKHEALKKCFAEIGFEMNEPRTRHEWIKDLAPSNEAGAPKKA